MFLLKPFLSQMPYKLIPTPNTFEDIPEMRDEKDRPILAAAIKNDVDYLITGDKDFLVLDITKPKIMTMQEFVEEFNQRLL